MQLEFLTRQWVERLVDERQDVIYHLLAISDLSVACEVSLKNLIASLRGLKLEAVKSKFVLTIDLFLFPYHNPSGDCKRFLNYYTNPSTSFG